MKVWFCSFCAANIKKHDRVQLAYGRGIDCPVCWIRDDYNNGAIVDIDVYSRYNDGEGTEYVSGLVVDMEDVDKARHEYLYNQKGGETM